MEQVISQTGTSEAILELYEDLQRQWFPQWKVSTRSIAHTDPFGGSELTILPTDDGNLLSTFKTWAVHYPPVGSAIYASKTVFKVEAENPSELLQKLSVEIRQIKPH